jgi:hypothetical protein
MPKIENGQQHLKEEDRLDEELEETFPASDPPSIVQPVQAEPLADAEIQHVRRNPVWQDQLAALMAVGGTLRLAGALQR